ncbi:hypothetical protein [Actinokineospora sp. HUAS TT18]|uniref:hypothetical protein n=1 Tax=Actinokineospora sp. HUAS TT18 TaxID=3447451 RepID=UPI003F5256CF
MLLSGGVASADAKAEDKGNAHGKAVGKSEIKKPKGKRPIDCQKRTHPTCETTAPAPTTAVPTVPATAPPLAAAPPPEPPTTPALSTPPPATTVDAPPAPPALSDATNLSHTGVAGTPTALACLAALGLGTGVVVIARRRATRST